MKNTTHPQTAEKLSWQEQARLRLKEGLLILLAVICIYLWMVLLSFDMNDPSFSNSTGHMDAVSNAGGHIGAWIADVLFSVLGYFAWLFPLVLMLKTVLVFQNRYQRMVFNGWLFALRAFGFILLLCSGSALAHIHFPVPEITPKNFNILGAVLGDALTGSLNVEGATLFLLACFLFGLTIYANLSWFKIMEAIGDLTLRVSQWVQAWLQATFGEIQERKQEKIRLREEEQDIEDEDDEPSIGTLRADKKEPVIVREAAVQEQPEPAQEVKPQGRREPVITPLTAQTLPADPVVPARAQPAKFSAKDVDSAGVGTLRPLSLLDKAERIKPSYAEE